MKSINIPDELYDKIEKVLDDYGFKTVDEFVVFVLKNALSDEEENEQVLSEEEEEMIKKRLRDLGYLD